MLLGVAPTDTGRGAWLADKIVGLRIFPDADGKMNRGVQDVGGGVLVVSQFTLYGDCRKGRRPSFIGAAPPEIAVPLYEVVRQRRAALGVPVATGPFRRHDARGAGQRRPGDLDRRHPVTPGQFALPFLLSASLSAG